jgi:hypothetical protein
MAHTHEVEKKNLSEKQLLQKQQLEQMQKVTTDNTPTLHHNTDDRWCGGENV